MKDKKTLWLIKAILVSLAIGSTSFAAPAEKTKIEKIIVKATGSDTYCSGSWIMWCGSASPKAATKEARAKLRDKAVDACDRLEGKPSQEDLDRNWSPECFMTATGVGCSITARISCIIPIKEAPVAAAPAKDPTEVVTTADGRRYLLLPEGAKEIRSIESAPVTAADGQ